MGFAATTVNITAGATPVLLVSGGGNVRPRQAVLQNVTTLGSIALISFGSATGVPTLGFQWSGTQPFSVDLRRGQDLYGGVVSSVADQKINILMDEI